MGPTRRRADGGAGCRRGKRQRKRPRRRRRALPPPRCASLSHQTWTRPPHARGPDLSLRRCQRGQTKPMLGRVRGRVPKRPDRQAASTFTGRMRTPRVRITGQPRATRPTPKSPRCAPVSKADVVIYIWSPHRPCINRVFSPVIYQAAASTWRRRVLYGVCAVAATAYIGSNAAPLIGAWSSQREPHPPTIGASFRWLN